MLCVLGASAQHAITGRLVDSTTGKDIPRATVTIYKRADTALVAYRLTDDKGIFKVTGIPPQLPCRMVITSVGFATIRKEFLLVNSDKDFGTIYLQPSGTDLEEVVVQSERPPVVYRKDTIEFNANAFKTLPNAVVEDLLKKLPGVQVDADGNISVGGKRVNRILVDGKSFFGNDPKMATKNLPSDVIDKVQVVDDEEQLNSSETDNKNNIGKVINLTFKKGMKKGVFGKAYAGAGTKDTYEAGMIANLFKDTMQLSVLGYSNNLNKPGFTQPELMNTGGLSRTQDVTGSSSSNNNNNFNGSSISINGINFGGLSNYGGISTSTGAGFTLNHAPSKKKTFFVQYFYGNVNTKASQQNTSEITNKDTLLRYTSNAGIKLHSGSHIANAGFKLKPDSVTNIQATLNMTYGKQRFNNLTLQDVSHNFLGRLSGGNILSDKFYNALSYSPYLNISRLSKKKKGRKVAMTLSYNYNDRNNDFYTDALMQYLKPLVYDSLIDQLRNEGILKKNLSSFLTYSEPLAKNIFLRVTGRYEWENLSNVTNTNGKTSSGYDQFYPLFSNTLARSSKRFGLYSGLEFKIKKWSITPGVRWQSQDFNTAVSGYAQPLVQKNKNILPQLSIRYDELSIEYDRDLVLPSYNYIIPVPDNSNPYLVYTGNLSLQPSLKDNIWLNYYKYFTAKSMNVWGWMNFSRADKEVINSINMDEKGVQTYFPVNSNGTKGFRTNAGVSKDYKTKSNFQYGWNVGWYMDFQNSNFIYNQYQSRQTTANVNTWGSVDFNWNDKFEWNQNFSWGLQSLNNTNPVFAGYKYGRYSIGTELISRPSKKFVLETQLDYVFNSAIQVKSLKKVIFWRAAVNYIFLKDDRGVIKLSAKDLLNKLTNTNVWLTQNKLSTTTSNVLSQYFMATFTYNLRKVGAKKKVGGQWNLW